MKLRKLVTLGGITLGALGLGMAIKSLMPQHFATFPPQDIWDEAKESTPLDISTFPAIEVSFLRCGSIAIPELVAVRGAFSLAPRVISHSAVLIRHPKATFLYDTGLSSAIFTYLADQSLFFRKTLANFQLEQSLGSHLQSRGIQQSEIETQSNNDAGASRIRSVAQRGRLDFVLLSHLHWDHVSGIPDIPTVPLRINRVEYDAAQSGLLDANNGLVRRLMGNNPIDLFDCAGPPYQGFRCSLDLFGDGSVVLVPLPGHTAGNTGMFINSSNGRIFLLGDAAWVSENYLRPATMHPFIWSAVTSDDATARQTLIELHHFARRHPEIPLIAMHDAEMQEKFMRTERQIQAAQREQGVESGYNNTD